VRPGSLREVAARSVADPGAFVDSCHEFLDAFYLAHGDKAAQAAMIHEAPEPTGRAFDDAWLGAMGEHLAQRWDLDPPAWTRDGAYDRLREPVFVPESKALRGYLLVASPSPFRSRLIFTGSEPLQRARFPRGEGEVRIALPWPRKPPRNGVDQPGGQGVIYRGEVPRPSPWPSE